jgi:hypothetical protein
MGFLELVKSGGLALGLPKKDPEDNVHAVEIFNIYTGTLFDPRDFNLGPDQQAAQIFIPGQSWGP